ncbi:hypothetical protein VaNZ11_003169 [Volvox africanus]|uniref:Uncharacterized protein n=1 Tax=Volvox africanus TaxID=51714 RepID=A0ABQ5RTK2_9CHLO|nr:hypothetical protein VaNZ11_003169 [Volvox africanus]
MKRYLGCMYMLLIIFFTLWNGTFAEQDAQEGFRGKTALNMVMFLLTSITAIVSSAYVLLGASVACQWPYPTCWCYTYPASDRVNGRCCSLYYANWAMASVWLLLATVSAVSRNASRLAVCLGYTLAHTLVTIFMRYKFSRFGLPVGPDGNDGSLVIPLERLGEQQQIPSNANGIIPTDTNCATGIPAYNLPTLIAVVGQCPAGCTCPYCCLARATEAACETPRLGRERGLNLCQITHSCGWHGVAPFDRVGELYLPGALQPAETWQDERGLGSSPESNYLPTYSSPLSGSSPRPFSSQSPSRPRTLSATPSSDRSALSPATLTVGSSGLLALGVPVPEALLLVEGLPLADVLRDRRGGNRDLHGGGRTAGSTSTEEPPGAPTAEPGRMGTGTEAGVARTGVGPQRAAEARNG